MESVQLRQYEKSYEEYKQELDTELSKTAESFVKIGYLLKVARDTDILAASPYDNVNEFARGEYGIDKTQVSRFIRINDRFSENGYSDRLEAGYRGFGYAKLTIMLQLPDAVNEELTPEYSKMEILALKEEVDAEHRISDLEMLAEDEKETTELFDDVLGKTLCQLGEDEPELFSRIHRAAVSTAWSVDEVKEELVPNEEKMYSVRVCGTGRMLLSVKEKEDSVTLTNIRSGNKLRYAWEEVLLRLKGLIDISSDAGAETQWEMIYGKEFPQKEKVAPVQQVKQEKKTKKETKIVKAKVPKPVKKPVEEQEVEEKEPEAEKKPEPSEAVMEEQLPGQMEVNDYKEVLPKEAEADIQEQAADKKEIQRKKCQEELSEYLGKIMVCVREQNFVAARNHMSIASRYVDRLEELK